MVAGEHPFYQIYAFVKLGGKNSRVGREGIVVWQLETAVGGPQPELMFERYRLFLPQSLIVSQTKLIDATKIHTRSCIRVRIIRVMNVRAGRV